MSDPIDQKYYDQLFKQVAHIMEHPSLPDDARLILHIFRSSSWGTPTNWTLYYPRTEFGAFDETSPTVRRIRWMSKHDIQRMNVVTQPAIPTLREADQPLPADDLHALMLTGAKIRVPLFDVNMSSGFDGNYYTMTLPTPTSSPIQSELRLKWWEHGAESWRAFAGWTLKIIELAESAFER
jgi:hypothetical protein